MRDKNHPSRCSLPSNFPAISSTPSADLFSDGCSARRRSCGSMASRAVRLPAVDNAPQYPILPDIVFAIQDRPKVLDDGGDWPEVWEEGSEDVSNWPVPVLQPFSEAHRLPDQLPGNQPAPPLAPAPRRSCRSARGPVGESRRKATREVDARRGRGVSGEAKAATRGEVKTGQVR